jgi:hypothetical protein
MQTISIKTLEANTPEDLGLKLSPELNAGFL